MRSAGGAVVLFAAVLHGCGGGTLRRPDAYVSAGSHEVKADRGSSCWSLAAGRRECLDASGPTGGSGGRELSVRRGASVALRFDRDDDPETLGAALDPAPPDGRGLLAVPVERRNPTSFVVDVRPGTYYLELGTRWPQGDMAFSLRLEVT